MKKIRIGDTTLYPCSAWKPTKTVKGETVKTEVKSCYLCYYNLFGYCWFDDVALLPESNNSTCIVALALDGIEWAKQKLHEILEKKGES